MSIRFDSEDCVGFDTSDIRTGLGLGSDNDSKSMPEDLLWLEAGFGAGAGAGVLSEKSPRRSCSAGFLDDGCIAWEDLTLIPWNMLTFLGSS